MKTQAHDIEKEVKKILRNMAKRAPTPKRPNNGENLSVGEAAKVLSYLNLKKIREGNQVFQSA